MKLDIDKIMEYKEDLENYNGLLPVCLSIFLDRYNYIENLRKKIIGKM